MQKTAKILIIDDEKDMAEGCSDILHTIGYKAFPVTSSATALDLMQQETFDLILCDLLMPEYDGMEVLQKAKLFAPHTPIAILTAYGTINRAVAAIQAGAFDFIEKPFEIDKLKSVIEKGLKQRDYFAERENILRQLEDNYAFDNIVGKSEPMLKIFEMVENTAASDVNVLITGESGTGKELIARSIHARSARSNKPFVPVNCGAFPETLFEAELFGYEKGAFTGANQRRTGLLESAQGGTFFLDEILELSVFLQAKLLRVLQDQQLRPLGGNGLIQVDVRLISATNRDIEEARSNALLRDDFYYRINVVNIHIPPLRERSDDILLLTNHFLSIAQKSSVKKIDGFSDEVLKCFVNYDWPGNVRELENTIYRAVTLAKNNIITLNEIPQQILESDSATNNNLNFVESKKRMTDELERKHIVRLLKKYHGNISKTSVELGISTRHLFRMLKRHGLDAKAWREK